MTKMDLIRNLAEDFNFGELHIAPVEVVKTVPCTLIPMPTQVIFNPPATIVYWEDGDKTVVRCDNDVFSEEFGYAMACMRKAYGSPRELQGAVQERIPPSAEAEEAEEGQGG